MFSTQMSSSTLAHVFWSLAGGSCTKVTVRMLGPFPEHWDMWLWGKTGSKRTEKVDIKGVFMGQTVARRALSVSGY